MIKILSSKKTLLVVFLVFLVAIVVFNFFDLTKDYSAFREYTHAQVESMEFQYVNINEADLKTLCDLPYVNEFQAKAIIEYREENGAYESIEEILKVKGIGEKTFERIKLNIVLLIITQ